MMDTFCNIVMLQQGSKWSERLLIVRVVIFVISLIINKLSLIVI